LHEKIELLKASLMEVVNKVNALVGGKSDARWALALALALALELEPGPTYLLNGQRTIPAVIDNLLGESLLRPHVGLNVDVAHMKIAGVSPVNLRDIQQEFPGCLIHSHISDHPGMHTHDQPVGTWTPVERYSGQDYGYLRCLWESFQVNDADDRPPRTGAIAVELEECSRLNWIHRSLGRLHHMFDVVKNHRDKIK
jgi:hypothetical protein